MKRDVLLEGLKLEDATDNTDIDTKECTGETGLFENSISMELGNRYQGRMKDLPSKSAHRPSNCKSP